MKKILYVLFAATLLISSLASANFGNDTYYEAEGVVYPEGQSPNAMRRIAVMDAYRYLAEEVDALNVTSTSTVKNMRDLDDQINTKVEAALRGAKVISVTRAGDGSFHAIVRMPKYGSQSVAAAVLKEDVVIEDFPKPKFVNIRSEINYTGLVIDCRGKNLSEAIIPTIKSAGGVEVYAYKNIGYQNTVERGMVEYSDNINSPRAGSSPLVVKAVNISGACDVIVSDEDSDKILAANQASNILANCAVVFVR
ncbi:MAG: LPP20 family lipoprotein [Selenomonadaceae bacterium]|nr:LPP20 family lipoprotein [Selenomonadaceae bacterium]